VKGLGEEIEEMNFRDFVFVIWGNFGRCFALAAKKDSEVACKRGGIARKIGDFGCAKVRETSRALGAEASSRRIENNEVGRLIMLL
jgi:hypothetical protein